MSEKVVFKVLDRCLSTHGAAGPFTPPCPYCGYDPRKYGHAVYDKGQLIEPAKDAEDSEEHES